MPAFESRVAFARKVSPKVVHFGVQKPAAFHYRTGEFTMLGLRVNGNDISRCYSIASRPDSPTVDFFVTSKRGGELSPRLFDLHEGDPILIGDFAAGTLLEDKLLPGGRDLWLFATGTGIAPFMSIAADETILAKYEQVIVVHGFSYWNDGAYVPQALTRNPKVRLFSCVSREPSAVLNCRIPDAIRNGLLEEVVGTRLDPSYSRAMVCGNTAMSTAVLDILRERGMQTEEESAQVRCLVEHFG